MTRDYNKEQWKRDKQDRLDTDLREAAGSYIDNPKKVNALLTQKTEHGLKPQLNFPTNALPLIEAVKADNPKTVRVLLDHGAWIWQEDFTRMNSLEYAVREDNAEILFMLLDEDKKIEEKVNPNSHLKHLRTTFRQASYYGRTTLMLKLLDRSLSSKDPQELNLALSYAAAYGQTETMQTLLQKGATDIDNALAYATQRGQKQAVEQLLNAGANPNNSNALESAITGKDNVHNVSGVKSLAFKVNNKLNAPLNNVANRAEIVALLIQHGAKLTENDKKALISANEPRYVQALSTPVNEKAVDQKPNSAAVSPEQELENKEEKKEQNVKYSAAVDFQEYRLKSQAQKDKKQNRRKLHEEFIKAASEGRTADVIRLLEEEGA